MNFLSHRVSKILIHLLFWALFVFISLFVFPEYHWKENPFLQYFFILLVIVYVNDFVLLPIFVRRKMYLLYVLLIGGIAFLATQLYCNYFAQCGCSIMKCLSDYLWQTLVPLVFFSFIWMLFRFLEKQAEVEAIRKEHTEMELQMLKAQINPHVLFNNLNTVYSYALEKPQEAPDLILRLSDNLKHVLYESNAPKVPLEKELEYIDNYIAFQKIRTENLKKVVYSKNIDELNHSIAPLLLITLIENAFKHSGSKSDVEVSIKVENDILTCSCRNKIKISDSESDNPKIGLKNLRKRLSLLYKNKYELNIEENEYFQVRLKLELL
ncbi:sensor histidine kinase [Maribacter halichondriae]|uniref:sensor histidine kinase n=1 Tax=Maribacter halichondriae TaxID=2980554 RepID=UPI00235A1CF2|nr:histidine kinase [Maribacter sp. Hal144]